MGQLGLADTLKLLAAGYKKKDIDAMAALDEKDPEPKQNDKKDPEQDDKKDPEQDDKKGPEQDDKKGPEPEPDYKKLFEESQTKQKELEEKIKKIQKDNINKNSAPDAAEAKKKEQESLLNMVKGYM